MSIHEQMSDVYCLELNQNATTTVNWLNIDTLARVVRRNLQLQAKGTTVHWLVIGVYPTVKAASEAGHAYQQEHAAEAPPEFVL